MEERKEMGSKVEGKGKGRREKEVGGKEKRGPIHL